MRLAATGEDIYGRIDTWVNAATVSVWGRVEDITDEEFDRVLRGNFLGQVYGAHAVLPALRRCGGGFIGVSSVEGSGRFRCTIRTPSASSPCAG